MVHEQPSCASSEIELPLDPGWIDLMPEPPRTSSWLRWRTSWHASHGPFYQVDKSTDHFRASQQLELSDSSNHNPSTDLNLPTEVCTGIAKTKEQSQRRAFNLIPITVSTPTDRLVRTGTQRNSSWPGETFSTQRPNTLPQTCLFAPKLFPCSPAADHTLSGHWFLHKR